MKKMIFLCALIPVAAGAMSSQLVPVSETFANNLAKVNRDGGKLYFFCKGAFGQMAERKAEDKPSELLTFFGEGGGKINEVTKCEYKPAAWYLTNIVRQHYSKLDLAFLKKFEALESDRQKTWQWFDEYFQEEGISKPFVAFKTQALSIEQAMMAQPERRKDGDPFEVAATLNTIANDLSTYAQELGLTGPDIGCPIQ